MSLNLSKLLNKDSGVGKLQNPNPKYFGNTLYEVISHNSVSQVNLDEVNRSLVEQNFGFFSAMLVKADMNDVQDYGYPNILLNQPVCLELHIEDARKANREAIQNSLLAIKRYCIVSNICFDYVTGVSHLAGGLQHIGFETTKVNDNCTLIANGYLFGIYIDVFKDLGLQQNLNSFKNIPSDLRVLISNKLKEMGFIDKGEGVMDGTYNGKYCRAEYSYMSSRLKRANSGGLAPIYFAYLTREDFLAK